MSRMAFKKAEKTHKLMQNEVYRSKGTLYTMTAILYDDQLCMRTNFINTVIQDNSKGLLMKNIIHLHKELIESECRSKYTLKKKHFFPFIIFFLIFHNMTNMEVCFAECHIYNLHQIACPLKEKIW